MEILFQAFKIWALFMMLAVMMTTAPECGPVPYVRFGYVSLNGNTTQYNSTADVICDDGYVAQNATITCRNTDRWDIPRCELLDCGSFPYVLYGMIDLPNITTFGASVNVSCVTGYEPNISVSTCLSNGRWEAVNCSRKDCGTPPSPINGYVDLAVNNYTLYEARAFQICDGVGFVMANQTIICLDGGWRASPLTSCEQIDCGPVPNVTFGQISSNWNTTYNSTADVICDDGYVSQNATITCRNTGVWDIPTCDPLDCGTPSKPLHGDVKLQNTIYGSVANYSCKEGYKISGNTSTECLYNGSWSYSKAQCIHINCGTLGNPENGRVNLTNGTRYRSTAVYSCNEGYSLVGNIRRICLLNGEWDYIEPKCVRKEVKIVKCPNNTDSRGMVWSEVLAGQTPKKSCMEGYTGNITRKCSSEGVWKLPQYNCFREQVQNVVTQVTVMDNFTSKEEVEQAVNEIINITTALTHSIGDDTIPETNKLTGGEIQALSSALEKVGELMNSNTDLVTDDITNNVISSINNIIDVDTNEDSLQSLKEADSRAAENILKTMSSVGEAIGKTLNNVQDKTIVKKNLALEVQKFSTADVIFPEPNSINTDEKEKQWLKETKSQIKLESESLKDNTVQYVIATVMYKDIAKLLPVETEDGDSQNENSETEADEETINGPILALTISPKNEAPRKFSPPIRITFEHTERNRSRPKCSFWQFEKDGKGSWAFEGCWVNTTNDNFTICECDHLTNFAVMMSPFTEVDSTTFAVRIISMIGIGISIGCVLATFVVHLSVWRYVRNDRTTILMNLCISLFFAYVVFLAGIERTESKVACAFIAGLLQYLYLVVFFVMLVEGIEIAVTVLYVFKTKSRIKILLTFAWILPGIIVAISAGSTQGEGYGNDVFCWLSTDNGLIWSFVGPVLVIILFNIICIILVVRAMLGTAAMESKNSTEKLKSSVRSLCVLVPVMGISWIFGLLQIKDGFIFVQIIFTIINGLQGLFIFIFHCLGNVQVKKGCTHLQRRRSSTSKLKSTFRSSSKENTSKRRDTKRSMFESNDMRSNGDNGVHSESNYHEWRKTALSPMIRGSAISPIVTIGVGRPAAPFSQQTRENLSSYEPTSKRYHMIGASHNLERVLHSEQF